MLVLIGKNARLLFEFTQTTVIQCFRFCFQRHKQSYLHLFSLKNFAPILIAISFKIRYLPDRAKKQKH